MAASATVLYKAGRTGARVVWCSTGVDGSSVGTALVLILVKSWMHWWPVPSKWIITGLLSVASS